MMWPVITENRDPNPEHEKYHPDNFPDGKMHLFSEKPGKRKLTEKPLSCSAKYL